MMLETERLVIRPFIMDDLVTIHRILNETFGELNASGGDAALEERREWLQWSIQSQKWLMQMHQPPYGDLAVTLRSTGQVIGSAGYVPCYGPFGQIPELATSSGPTRLYRPEFGLFWAIEPARQRQGYASEAARALIENAFARLQLERIIATTEYANLASQAVMRKVGMRILRNPLPEPEWLQVVGVLENKGAWPDLLSSNTRIV